ncbi:MAG: hypothetical protein V8S14_03480 [Lachnospiraceae bacterium]
MADVYYTDAAGTKKLAKETYEGDPTVHLTTQHNRMKDRSRNAL